MYDQLYHLKIVVLFLIFLGGLYFYITYSSRTKALEGLTTINGELRCPNILIQKGPKYYLYNSNIDEVPGVNPIAFNNLDEYTKFLEWQHSAGIRCPVLYVQNTYDAQGNRVYKMRPSVIEPQGGLPSVSTSVQDNKTSVSNNKTSVSDNKTSVSTSVQNNKTSVFTDANSDILNDVKSAPAGRLGSGFTKLVDATRNDHPYNLNNYPAFDQTSYYVGSVTPLDKIANNDGLLYNSGGTNEKSDNPMDPNWGGADYTQKLVDNGYYKDNEVSILVP